jgi:alkylhydroperoxidase family enzyme
VLGLGNEQLVEAVLENWRTAQVNDKMRSMLGFLEKFTLYPGEVGPDDVEALRATGVTDRAIEEAMYVGFLLNLMNRLADAFGFEIPSPEQIQRNGRALYKQGYWADSIPG